MATVCTPNEGRRSKTTLVGVFAALWTRLLAWVNAADDRLDALEAGGAGALPEVYATKAAFKASLTVVDEALYGIEDGGFFLYDADSAAAADDTTVLEMAAGGRAIKVAYAAHTHAQADVTGLVDALAGKAATSHTQAISTVTGLQTALDGKAATTDLLALPPVLNFYDPTAALPATPTLGDRYIASATANGWTVWRVYECTAEEIADPPTPAEWTATVPVTGNTILSHEGGAPAVPVNYFFDAAMWQAMNVPGNNTAGAQAAAAVAADGLFFLPVAIHKTFDAGVAGAADDVQILAVNTLPFPFVVLNILGLISAGGSAGRTVQIRTAAGGLGSLLGTVDAAADGAVNAHGDEATPATPAADAGLFLRRSHDAVAGKITLVCARAPVV